MGPAKWENTKVLPEGSYTPHGVEKHSSSKKKAELELENQAQGPPLKVQSETGPLKQQEAADRRHIWARDLKDHSGNH